LVEDSFGLHKIYENFSGNSFFLKYHIRISIEYGIKRDKFEVKRVHIELKNLKKFGVKFRHTFSNFIMGAY